MWLIPSVRILHQCFDRLLVARMFGFHERHPAQAKPVALIVALSRMSMTTLAGNRISQPQPSSNPVSALTQAASFEFTA
jgi:hypothetical protein